VSNVLNAIPTGLGDVARSMLDSVLPKELEFLSGAVAGVLDLETGNLVGAAKNFIDAVLDVKDLVQTQKGPAGSPPTSMTPSYPWCYEPPPPPIGAAATAAKAAAVNAVSLAATSPTAKTTATPADPKVDATTLSRSSFLGLPDDAFMSAIREGKIPKEIAESKDAMLALQARMTQITEMNQLMTSMLQAIHQLRMGVIQNLRV
jgi:hypothetical protein